MARRSWRPAGGPEQIDGQFPRAWVNSWGWSVALPDSVLTHWQAAIEQVSEKYGHPNAAEFDTRVSASGFLVERSAYSTEKLAAIPVLEAAQLVAQWRPDNASDGQMLGARELARALEVVVTDNVAAWIQDPAIVVATLREPLYVLHYFYALIAKAREAAAETPSLLDTVRRVRTAHQDPTVLGYDAFDYELNWRNVDSAGIELARALANADGDLSAHLDTVWDWARESIDLTPDPTEVESLTADMDTLRRAMSSDSGRALLATIAFAAWEYRRTEAVRADFSSLLDRVLAVDGTRGANYRALLAVRRPLLETLVPDWLTTNRSLLFGDNEVGAATFDITLQHAHPTAWLRDTLRERLLSAANSGSKPAITSLLLAVLDRSPEYTSDTILTALRGNTASLSTANETMAFLVQECDADDPRIPIASGFWRALIDADRGDVPAAVLSSSGRWAFVTGLDGDTWSTLTLRALDTTAGQIDLVTEVADRCETVAATEWASRILLLLLGQGEPWERHYVAQAAIKVLSALLGLGDQNARRLRTRLIDLGYHAAENIPLPPANGDEPIE